MPQDKPQRDEDQPRDGEEVVVTTPDTEVEVQE